jgi:hypothetical protein
MKRTTRHEEGEVSLVYDMKGQINITASLKKS